MISMTCNLDAKRFVSLGEIFVSLLLFSEPLRTRETKWPRSALRSGGLVIARSPKADAAIQRPQGAGDSWIAAPWLATRARDDARIPS
jgi:hypothetical protein